MDAAALLREWLHVNVPGPDLRRRTQEYLDAQEVLEADAQVIRSDPAEARQYVAA